MHRSDVPSRSCYHLPDQLVGLEEEEWRKPIDKSPTVITVGLLSIILSFLMVYLIRRPIILSNSPKIMSASPSMLNQSSLSIFDSSPVSPQWVAPAKT